MFKTLLSNSKTTQELTSLTLFYSICADIYNIAPVKLKKPKVPSQPWVNEEIRSLNTDCRGAERKRWAMKAPVQLEKLMGLMKEFSQKIKLHIQFFFPI